MASNYEALDPIGRTAGTSFFSYSNSQGIGYEYSFPVMPYVNKDGIATTFDDVLLRVVWGTNPNGGGGVVNYYFSTTSRISYSLNVFITNPNEPNQTSRYLNRLDVDNAVNITNINLNLSSNGFISGTIVPFTRDYADFGSDAWEQGYETGYNNGYDIGFNDGVVEGSVTESSIGSLMSSVFKGVEQVLSIEIVPNINVGTIVSIPIVLSLLLFLIKMVRS